MMLIPGSGDSTTLINLINLISDPKAFESNLKELSSLSSELEKQRKLLQKETEDKEKLKVVLEDNQTLNDTLSRSITDYEAKSLALKTSIDSFTKDKAEFEISSKETLDGLSKQKIFLNSREANIANLESQAKDLVSKANEENDKAISVRNEFEAKLSKLKDAIS